MALAAIQGLGKRRASAAIWIMLCMERSDTAMGTRKIMVIQPWGRGSSCCAIHACAKICCCAFVQGPAAKRFVPSLSGNRWAGTYGSLACCWILALSSIYFDQPLRGLLLTRVFPAEAHVKLLLDPAQLGTSVFVKVATSAIRTQLPVYQRSSLQ